MRHLERRLEVAERNLRIARDENDAALVRRKKHAREIRDLKKRIKYRDEYEERVEDRKIADQHPNRVLVLRARLSAGRWINVAWSSEGESVVDFLGWAKDELRTYEGQILETTVVARHHDSSPYFRDPDPLPRAMAPGYEWTGEYRKPRDGDEYLASSDRRGGQPLDSPCVLMCDPLEADNWDYGDRFIVRKVVSYQDRLARHFKKIERNV
jgi:hypothetical protein